MVKVVVIGGGWAGCAAAAAAAKSGASVTLLERTDMLLGTGLVGGIMRNNGRWTATEENIALGGGDLFFLADEAARHKEIDFPGHKHANLYDVALMEPRVRKYLQEKNVNIIILRTVRDAITEAARIKGVKLSDGSVVEGDVYVEATGTAGGMPNCKKYGNGCVMCILRCPSFGPRVSIAAKAGVKEMMGKKTDGTIGAMSGSCKILKESLDAEIVETLNKQGVAVIPIPDKLQKTGTLDKKACQQYATLEYSSNVVLLDTGHAKLMTTHFPLQDLRQIPGFENARYEDPYCGGIGNSIRYLAISPRDNCLQVEGLDNLFCAGEKAGLLVGHTEAIVTGTLAGHNAVRSALQEPLLELPRSLMVGESIAWVKEQMAAQGGMGNKYTFSGSVLLEHLAEQNLYTTDKAEIQQRVEAGGLTDLYNRKLL